MHAQRFQHKLPGPDCSRIANETRFPCQESPDQIWNQLVARPIATTNRITRAGGPERNAMLLKRIGRKIRITISRGHKFGATLGVGVRIASAHGLVFPIAPDPLASRVAFVTGDIDHRTVKLKLPHSFQNVNCDHYVRRVGLDWIFVATTNNGLCSHVENHVRPGIGKDLYEARQVAGVRKHGRSRCCDVGLFEDTWLRWRSEGIPCYLCPNRSPPEED